MAKESRNLPNEPSKPAERHPVSKEAPAVEERELTAAFELET